MGERNRKKRRISVYQILQKRGLNPNFPDNSNLESKEENSNNKLKSSKKNDIHDRSSDEKSNKLEKIPEKEEDIIKETHFGVKYIVFQNKNELKTIYKKEKWKLSMSKITSIFLKAIRPKEIKNKNEKNTIKLKEIGPRLNLNIFKIQEGFFKGNVVYHSLIKKTRKEIYEILTEKKNKEK